MERVAFRRCVALLVVTARARALGWRTVLVGAAALLGATPAVGVATGRELYVDGGCAVAGDGTVVAPCAGSPGAAGPFGRISAGIAALTPGDTLAVRGRHDAFDGVYRGDVLAI